MLGESIVMVTTKDMVQVYMFTLHVLATKDDLVSDDREAFNTVVWKTFEWHFFFFAA